MEINTKHTSIQRTLHQEFIPKATKAKNIILDGEILMIDTKTRKPLPFGSLGKNKQKDFPNAQVCVFLFDILSLEDKSLLHTPFEERRKIMLKNVNVIQNRVEMSEQHYLETEDELWELMNKVIESNQEGLVVKPVGSIYEPQARHWIKIKRDYLDGMGDSVDLNVLGAYWGTGNKGGQLTVFMCGVYDKKSDTWKTVSRV